MRFRPATLALTFAIAASLRASDLPTVTAPLPDLTTVQGAALPARDLRSHFEIADIHGQVVQFRTSLGTYNLEMLPAAAPLSVANFLTYVNGSRFVDSFIHRAVQSLGIIQGGGYVVTSPNPLQVATIATDPPIVLEYNLPNTRGTIAMARTAVQNSATSQWFINTVDNTITLGSGNGGGYAVFGRVTGTGMTIVDAIQAVPVYNAGGAFATLPLVGYAGGAIVAANLVQVQAVEAVPVFPATAGQNSVVTFSVANTNLALVAPTVAGSALQLALVPGASGIADCTVTATDSNGNAVQNSFRLQVLSFTADTDGDGLNDASEWRMAPLGFDWQVSQPALVTNYFANANGAGLYTAAQVQALHVGVPLLQRNSVTGVFKLTIGVKKATALTLPFTDFPMNAPGTSAAIDAQGRLEFEFSVPDDAAFFRLEAQ